MDNTILIHRYLNKEMDSSESSDFEKKLASNTILQEELFIQQQIMKAAENAGLKSIFAGEIKRRTRLKKYKTALTIIIVCVIVSVVYFFKDKLFIQSSETVQVTITNDTTSFINPPLASINVPFETYNIIAEKGDTIYHSSGSVLYFPAHAFKDANGNLVKGEVTVEYREFRTAVDFFVSGIPMHYDSAGKKYIFESSGMCEINARQENKILYVNTEAQPEILLSATNNSDLHNLYYLDTVNRRWDFIGKDQITVILKIKPIPQNISKNTTTEYIHIPVKPVMPAKADENKQSFSIEIDPGSFEELFVYDKLKMQVVNEADYKRSDANEHWDNMKLEHTSKEGIYTISFYNSRRTVTYTVQPVLEGADYSDAIKKFNEQKKKYDLALTRRKAKEEKENDSINNLVTLQKKEMEKNSEFNRRINEFISERNRISALMQKQDTNDFGKANEIIRSFPISNFGVWNCDHPLFPNAELPITGVFKNQLNETLFLKRVAVIYKSFNGQAQFYVPNIKVVPGQPNMIWAISGNDFYYFTYEDYNQVKLSPATREYLFTMRKADKPVHSYEDIKQLIKDL